jgi:hypothetical protein
MKATRDYSKLPKWVQLEIIKLRADVEYARAKLSLGPDDALIFADPYNESPRPIGDKNTTVEFRLGENWNDRVRVRIENGELYINGGQTLAVTPWASNVIKVRTFNSLAAP